ncbi:beta-lactamase family protein [Parvularcula sp. ZS-1/3]|uniref:Beta-lactamase n=1 Tax=Parvularcula mediterranea TaxID=2732508 RepID=A0A7Y3RNJ3_9PROT|nr:serine hydrolase domain-containing protein [Parvularcula mediterranea]NNU17356.1 beta-lactamase family protein [Parvularcula mediterranea]
MIIRLIAALGALIASASANGLTEENRAFIEEAMADLGMVGFGIAYIGPDGAREAEGYGVAYEGGPAITPDTPFELGSVSKNFSALVMLQLADEGFASLDDPVRKYLPSFTLKGGKGGDITIRQLITHRSGISTLDGNRDHAITRRDQGVTAELVAGLSKVMPVAEPGEVLQYSNANYMTLQLVIETLTGNPLEEELEARIFAPLGMGNSGTVVTPPEGKAKPHRDFFGSVRESDLDMGRQGIAKGGVVASANDLATYVQAVASGDPRIVPRSMKAELVSPYGGGEVGYAMGWFVGPHEGRLLVGHDGLNPGFQAIAYVFPDTGELVVGAVNHSGSGSEAFLRAVAFRVIGRGEPDHRPDLFRKAQLWVPSLAALLVTSGFFLWAWRAVTAPKEAGPLGLILPTLVLGGLAYGAVVTIPAIGGASFSAAAAFYPDLGLALMMIASVSLLWAALRLGQQLLLRIKSG